MLTSVKLKSFFIGGNQGHFEACIQGLKDKLSADFDPVIIINNRVRNFSY